MAAVEERLHILDGWPCQYCEREAVFWNIDGYFCAQHWATHWERIYQRQGEIKIGRMKRVPGNDRLGNKLQT